jgi:hypothetical protein
MRAKRALRSLKSCSQYHTVPQFPVPIVSNNHYLNIIQFLNFVTAPCSRRRPFTLEAVPIVQQAVSNTVSGPRFYPPFALFWAVLEQCFCPASGRWFHLFVVGESVLNTLL